MSGIPYVTRSTLAERTAAWMAAIEPWSRGRGVPSLDRAALLVLDLQRYFASPGSHAHLPALGVVLPRILRLVEQFRDSERPVVYTRHGSAPELPNETLMQRWWRDDLRQGEERAGLVEELKPRGEELVLDKQCYSALRGTGLQAWLNGHGCDTVVICGVMTHLCCESTAREAFMLDIAPVMVADACASLDEELHLGSLRNLSHGFAVVATSAAVQEALTWRAVPPDSTPATEAPAPESMVDLAVVGAGPAGVAAAIQGARAGLQVEVIDPGPPGGQARTANCIENYPGFPGGIPGDRLMDRFAAQLGALELRVRPCRVRAIAARADRFTLELDPGRAVTARAVIVATGAAPRSLDPVLDSPEVHGVIALPARLNGKRILVIGGGEAALDQALMARRRGAEEVIVAARGPRLRAMELLVQRAAGQGIDVRLETTLGSVEPGEGGRRRVVLEHGGGRQELTVDAVVVCVGKVSQHPKLPERVERGGDGVPRVDSVGRTSVPGLYLAGDVHRGPYRQVSIAVGDGVAASMDVVRYLQPASTKRRDEKI